MIDNTFIRNRLCFDYAFDIESKNAYIERLNIRLFIILLILLVKHNSSINNSNKNSSKAMYAPFPLSTVIPVVEILTKHTYKALK